MTIKAVTVTVMQSEKDQIHQKPRELNHAKTFPYRLNPTIANTSNIETSEDQISQDDNEGSL